MFNIIRFIFITLIMFTVLFFFFSISLVFGWFMLVMVIAFGVVTGGSLYGLNLSES